MNAHRKCIIAMATDSVSTPLARLRVTVRVDLLEMECNVEKVSTLVKLCTKLCLI